jgi:Fungal Zn(2)-Cys(6) binuclear cluster domain
MDSNSTSQFLAQYSVRLNLAPSTQQNSIAPTNTRSRSSPSLDSNEMAPPTSATDDKTKRLTACLVCRKRKLKCDSARPKCASCARLGHAWYIPWSDLRS